MQKNTKNKMLIIVTAIMLLMLIITSIHTNTFALTPNEITGDSDIKVETDITDKATDLISKIGIFIAVGVMMIIGIRYMTGSLEDRAAYKKSMMPYLIGCLLLFGASSLAPKIIDTFKDMGSNEEEIGNNILHIIQVAGTIISVGVLMLLGLKYMMGSTEEKATYKKSMIPYLIGTILLFGAVNITSAVYDAAVVVGQDIGSATRNEGNSNYKHGQNRGNQKGQELLKDDDREGYEKALKDAEQRYYEQNAKDPDSDATQDALGYYDGLVEGFNPRTKC